MKRKTAIKKLMSVGYSRNHANTLMDRKTQKANNAQRCVLLAYCGMQAKSLGQPLDGINDVVLAVSHNTVTVEVLID